MQQQVATRFQIGADSLELSDIRRKRRPMRFHGAQRDHPGRSENKNQQGLHEKTEIERKRDAYSDFHIFSYGVYRVGL